MDSDVTGELEVPEDSNLNIEGKDNVALCPICTEPLGPTLDQNYAYKRNNPDTRWFWCAHCECHLGFHRMRKSWKIDPEDLNNSTTAREYFGLDTGE